MTHVRYRVVGFAVALAMVTYLDRVCISMMAPSIMHDLGLDKPRLRLRVQRVHSRFWIV